MPFINEKEPMAYNTHTTWGHLNCILLKERRELKGYILYDPMYMAVSIWQNYRTENSSVAARGTGWEERPHRSMREF